MDQRSPTFFSTICCCLGPLIVIAVVIVLAVQPLRTMVFQRLGLAKKTAQPIYRPLRGRMAVLSADAYRQITSVHRPDNPWLADAGDLLAVFRLAREVASPEYTDPWIMHQIDEQVRVSVDGPPVFLFRTHALLEQVQPRTDDISQAVAVLNYVANTEWYGAVPVIVATTIRYFIENGPPGTR